MADRKGTRGAAAGDPDRALAFIDAHFEEHVTDLQEYLRVDNVLTHRDRCDEVARRLKTEIEALGGQASILDYGDLPFVYGGLDAGAPRTLVIYRNYDVVPPEGADWSAPPFSGRVRRIEDVGECLVSRGACDPKGPLVGTLRAIEAVVRSEGRLPVNLIFLLEGDEQLGSPTLPKVIRDRRRDLKAAQGVLYPKFCQGKGGDPVLPLGVKGMLLLDFICSGGAWGGPTRSSIHSGNAAWVASPAWRMVRALATLLDEDETVLVDGFYDDVVQVIQEPPERQEERRVAVIEDQYEFLRSRHVLRFKHDLPPAALCRKYLGNPTFNIGNILIHRSRAWSQFLLPCEVRAQVDVRLVPDQDPATISDAIRHHLKDHGFPDIEVVTRLAYPPWSIEEDHPLVRTTRRVYHEFGKEAEIHASSGTSQSFSLFHEIGLPLVVAGLGSGGRSFHTSEYASIAGLREFEKSIVRFLHAFDGTGG
ncbi:MAG TPA: M20/M25/M40 family metallo-hydrolase [Candidatus Polarisedimenticolia bacterium]|nr:M20/M25/M40 family metallo-hydrolase [Candidatus Polarisedimenticolia bacterium]